MNNVLPSWSIVFTDDEETDNEEEEEEELDIFYFC